METPCWSPSEGLQHGGRKPVEISGVYFGSLKTLILSVKLKNIRLSTSLNILVPQNRLINTYIVQVTCHQETMPMSRIAKRTCSIFKTKLACFRLSVVGTGKKGRARGKNEGGLRRGRKAPRLALVLPRFFLARFRSSPTTESLEQAKTKRSTESKTGQQIYV